MTRAETPAPQRAQRLVVRAGVPADLDPLARFHVGVWREAYRGLMPDSLLDRPDLEARLSLWSDLLGQPEGRIVSVALVGGEIAGFATGGAAHPPMVGYHAEIYALYVGAPFRRQGVAGLLLAASAERLRRHGANDLVIWTLRDNKRARAFYEALGGQLSGSRWKRFFDVELPEVAYGWPELELLIAAGAPRARKGPR